MTHDPPASAPDQPAPDQPDQPAPDQAAQAAPDQAARAAPAAPDQADQDGQPASSWPDQAGGPPSPTGTAPSRRRLVLLVAAGAVVALAILVVGALVVAGITGSGGPEAGDCMNDSPLANEMEVVDCDSDQAAWSVIGIDTGWTFGDFDAASLQEVCRDHPGTVQALWVTDSSDVSDGTDGDVVCLGPLDPAPVGG